MWSDLPFPWCFCVLAGAAHGEGTIAPLVKNCSTKTEISLEECKTAFRALLFQPCCNNTTKGDFTCSIAYCRFCSISESVLDTTGINSITTHIYSSCFVNNINKTSETSCKMGSSFLQQIDCQPVEDIFYVWVFFLWIWEYSCINGLWVFGGSGWLCSCRGKEKGNSPCLAQVEGLSIYVLWVDFYWEQVWHFIYGPLELCWRLKNKIILLDMCGIYPHVQPHIYCHHQEQLNTNFMLEIHSP